MSEKKLKAIAQHSQKIDIVAPQIYELNGQGHLWGQVDSQLLDLARTKKFNIMPLVINVNFDQTVMHNFLVDETAQARAIEEMLRLAAEYHFYGWQFDFENINAQDKDLYTRFVRKTAAIFHKQGLQLSVAVVPHTADELTNDYDRWIHENWSGAFDYKELGKIADFITLMSYDNHTTLTTPGPIAPLHWVERTLVEVLKSVPANKISLGIPAYSGYWTTGKLRIANIPERYSFRGKASQISYINAKALLAKFNGNVLWNKKWQSSYAILENNNKLDYVFIENAAAFQAKLALVKRYHLRGFSVWQLGMEDSEIWKFVN